MAVPNIRIENTDADANELLRRLARVQQLQARLNQLEALLSQQHKRTDILQRELLIKTRADLERARIYFKSYLQKQAFALIAASAWLYLDCKYLAKDQSDFFIKAICIGIFISSFSANILANLRLYKMKPLPMATHDLLHDTTYKLATTALFAYNAVRNKAGLYALKDFIFSEPNADLFVQVKDAASYTTANQLKF